MQPPTPSGLLDPRIESLPPIPVPDQDFSGRLDGVIILVSAGDVYLAKACCASVRLSMGNIPITLLVDGPETNTAELERLPHVQRLVVQEVMDSDYAPFGTGFWVKLLIFWKSPYERFLYLDADTLVWGDLRAYAEFDKYDFIAAFDFTAPRMQRTVADVLRNAFDVEYIEKKDPVPVWRGQELANNGAFFARRGVFSKALLMEVRQWPCWRCYEQGVLNYLRWRALRDGAPRMGGRPLQICPAEITCRLEDRLMPRDGRRRPAIIHWICKKPKLGRRYQAHDDHRRLFLKMTGRTRFLAMRLFLEDVSVWLGRHMRSLSGRRRRS